MPDLRRTRSSVADQDKKYNTIEIRWRDSLLRIHGDDQSLNTGDGGPPGDGLSSDLSRKRVEVLGSKATVRSPPTFRNLRRAMRWLQCDRGALRPRAMERVHKYKDDVGGRARSTRHRAQRLETAGIIRVHGGRIIGNVPVSLRWTVAQQVTCA